MTVSKARKRALGAIYHPEVAVEVDSTPDGSMQVEDGTPPVDAKWSIGDLVVFEDARIDEVNAIDLSNPNSHPNCMYLSKTAADDKIGLYTKSPKSVIIVQVIV